MAMFRKLCAVVVLAVAAVGFSLGCQPQEGGGDTGGGEAPASGSDTNTT